MGVFTETFDGKPCRRIEVLGDNRVTEKTTSHGGNTFSLQALRTLFVTVFMPQGYPDSVSPDYLSYQVWDTVQALASSLTGALATEAVLKGAGVGDEKASALAASLTWIVKDGLGMVGRIAFTYLKGTDLDSNPKKWRLVADILNDVAFCLDLLSPSCPSLFFPLACLSSLFRCVVGVAGGATRTAITQHQARRNNLADVAAKDGSQETLVNVVALVASLVLLPAVSGHRTLIWTLFALFTMVHLYANYRAVRSLTIQSLNRNRATIAISCFLNTSTVPTVLECNEKEPLFYSLCGRRHLGCSLRNLLQYSQRVPSAKLVTTEDYTLLLDCSRDVGWLCVSSSFSSSPLLPFFHLQCLSSSKPFDASQFHNFVSSLEKENFHPHTLHLGFDQWAYSVDN